MHVCVFLSQSASVEHSHRFPGPSKMADRPGPRRDRTGHQYCHLASHFRCFPAVFPLFSRCVPAGSTTIKRQEEPRGIGRKSVCVCHVKLMHHHHVSGRCVPVSKCVSRAFSDRLPSKMADRPPYRNESSVHAPFPYITRRPGFVQTPPQESTHS